MVVTNRECLVDLVSALLADDVKVLTLLLAVALLGVRAEMEQDLMVREKENVSAGVGTGAVSMMERVRRMTTTRPANK